MKTELEVAIRSAQNAHSAFMGRNFPGATASDCMVKLAEEVGELARQVGHDAWQPAAYDHEQARDAVADVFISLLGVATMMGVNAGGAIADTLPRVCARDYHA